MYHLNTCKWNGSIKMLISIRRHTTNKTENRLSCFNWRDSRDFLSKTKLSAIAKQNIIFHQIDFARLLNVLYVVWNSWRVFISPSKASWRVFISPSKDASLPIEEEHFCDGILANSTSTLYFVRRWVRLGVSSFPIAGLRSSRKRVYYVAIAHSIAESAFEQTK